LLRLYALRLSPSFFIITGGAIKLSAKMDRPYLQHQLARINEVERWLATIGYSAPFYDLTELSALLK
jgi:hypothetical protein